MTLPTPSKPTTRPIIAAKTILSKEKKRKGGKNSKVEKPKAIGHFLIHKF